MIKFTIHGRPVPAVRMTQRSMYKNPQAQRYLEYKNSVGWSAKKAGARITKQQVAINIYVYLCGGQIGDWDNYAKSICDGLNGVAWLDDKQVVQGFVRRFMCNTKEEQRVEVTILEVVDNDF